VAQHQPQKVMYLHSLCHAHVQAAEEELTAAAADLAVLQRQLWLPLQNWPRLAHQTQLHTTSRPKGLGLQPLWPIERSLVQAPIVPQAAHKIQSPCDTVWVKVAIGQSVASPQWLHEETVAVGAGLTAAAAQPRAMAADASDAPSGSAVASCWLQQEPQPRRAPWSFHPAPGWASLRLPRFGPMHLQMHLALPKCPRVASAKLCSLSSCVRANSACAAGLWKVHAAAAAAAAAAATAAALAGAAAALVLAALLGVVVVAAVVHHIAVAWLTGHVPRA